eukprot:SAG22_NODE_3571_length_1636_cov_1.577749_2_plen_102_part_00
MIRTVTDELWENERRLTQWSAFSAASLFTTDRPAFSTATGRPRGKGAAAPSGWRYITDWELEGGWEFSFGFDRGGWSAKGGKAGRSDFVRRRRWVRVRRLA